MESEIVVELEIVESELARLLRVYRRKPLGDITPGFDRANQEQLVPTYKDEVGLVELWLGGMLKRAPKNLRPTPGACFIRQRHGQSQENYGFRVQGLGFGV